MEYNDYMEVMPDDVIRKLNQGYGRRVDTLAVGGIEEKQMQNALNKLYYLISKSSAYFNCYKDGKIKVSACNNVNRKHKDIIKAFGCCNDFSIYEGYLVPRYLNMDRCYCDHYNCEMDILKILLLLLGLKTLLGREKIYDMALERLEIIDSLVLQK